MSARLRRRRRGRDGEGEAAKARPPCILYSIVLPSRPVLLSGPVLHARLGLLAISSILPDPAFRLSIRPSARPSVISVSTTPTPHTEPELVILPCSRHWTAPERVRKLGKGCCIASLGFGRVVTLIDVILVASHGGGHCGSGSEICLFRKRV